MPSPVGHALGAAMAGWVIAGPATEARPRGRRTLADSWRQLGAPANLRRALAFAAMGVLPDLDLLAGSHSAYTHSLGAATCVFAAALAIVGRHRWLLALAAAAAYFSHPVFDYLGEDTSVPLGVMLWWPLSTAHFHSGLDLFQAISRRYWLPGFWALNASSVVRELLLLVPLASAVLVLRRGRQRR